MTDYVRHPEQPVTVNIAMTGGVFAKSTTFPRVGMIAPQHAHSYDHLSIIASGAVELEKNGRSMGLYEAPAVIKIEARTKHLFRIVKPSTTVICVHNSDHAVEGEVPIHEEHHLDFQDEP